jgi:hypothetical protein
MLDKLDDTPTIANVDSYRKRWGEHSLRKDGSQIPNIAFQYNPKCRREVGRPRKGSEL